MHSCTVLPGCQHPRYNLWNRAPTDSCPHLGCNSAITVFVELQTTAFSTDFNRCYTLWQSPARKQYAFQNNSMWEATHQCERLLELCHLPAVAVVVRCSAQPCGQSYKHSREIPVPKAPHKLLYSPARTERSAGLQHNPCLPGSKLATEHPFWLGQLTSTTHSSVRAAASAMLADRGNSCTPRACRSVWQASSTSAPNRQRAN